MALRSGRIDSFNRQGVSVKRFFFIPKEKARSNAGEDSDRGNPLCCVSVQSVDGHVVMWLFSSDSSSARSCFFLLYDCDWSRRFREAAFPVIGPFFASIPHFRPT